MLVKGLARELVMVWPLAATGSALVPAAQRNRL